MHYTMQTQFKVEGKHTLDKHVSEFCIPGLAQRSIKQSGWAGTSSSGSRTEVTLWRAYWLRTCYKYRPHLQIFIVYRLPGISIIHIFASLQKFCLTIRGSVPYSEVLWFCYIICRLSLGSVTLDVAMGTPCGFLQQLVTVQLDHKVPEIHGEVLGQLSHQLVCTLTHFEIHVAVVHLRICMHFDYEFQTCGCELASIRDTLAFSSWSSCR